MHNESSQETVYAERDVPPGSPLIGRDILSGSSEPYKSSKSEV